MINVVMSKAFIDHGVTKGTIIYWLGSVLVETRYIGGRIGIEFKNYIISIDNAAMGICICNITETDLMEDPTVIQNYVDSTIAPIILMAIDGKR